MSHIVLDPDPRSTVEASDEYKRAWFSVYGDGSPEEPPREGGTPDPFLIDERVLPDYLQRHSIDQFIADEVAEGLASYNPTVVEEFSFAVGQNKWVCVHSMNRRVLDVVTTDLNGNELYGDVVFESESRVVVNWARPQTGFVRLST